MGKVPSYTRRAIEKYRKGKYTVSVTLPSEYREIISSMGYSGNGFINEAVRNELIRRNALTEDGEQISADHPQ